MVNYRLYTSTYRLAFINRIKIINHYYSEVRQDLCEGSYEKASEQEYLYPERIKWQTHPADVENNSLIKRAFFALFTYARFGTLAFVNSPHPQKQLRDALVYSEVQRDVDARIALNTKLFGNDNIESYRERVHELYQKSRERKYRPSPSEHFISQAFYSLQLKAYLLATRSVITRGCLSLFNNSTER